MEQAHSFFGVMLCSLATAQELIWLETKKIDEYGGWTNDWQFLVQMGSPYMLATGLGSPVEDAHTQVNATSKGKHRVWVRTKKLDTAYKNNKNEAKKLKVTVQYRVRIACFGFRLYIKNTGPRKGI